MKARVNHQNILFKGHGMACLFGLLIATFSINVFAATNEKDMKIAMRAIKFLSDGPTGNVKTAIIYNPGDAASQDEANSIKGFIEANPKAGSATLQPQLVSVDALADIQGSKVVMLTSNIGSNHAATFDEAVKSGAISISTDKSCVENGFCVVGISSDPKVEIFVNKAAATKTNTNFKTAFMMLVNVL